MLRDVPRYPADHEARDSTTLPNSTTTTDGLIE
jgi:hypothetical protein